MAEALAALEHPNCRCTVEVTVRDDDARTFIPGLMTHREAGLFRVGRFQVDDAGYLFRFSADPEQHPIIERKDRVVTAGREWMRKHVPRQWAAFMAARILGQDDVVIVPEMEDHPLVLKEDEEFTP